LANILAALVRSGHPSSVRKIFLKKVYFSIFLLSGSKKSLWVRLKNIQIGPLLTAGQKYAPVMTPI